MLEKYRSGHNEHDWKSCCRDERHAGSNPAFSAKKKSAMQCMVLFLLAEEIRFTPDKKHLLTHCFRSALFLLLPLSFFQKSHHVLHGGFLLQICCNSRTKHTVFILQEKLRQYSSLLTYYIEIINFLFGSYQKAAILKRFPHIVFPQKRLLSRPAQFHINMQL